MDSNYKHWRIPKTYIVVQYPTNWGPHEGSKSEGACP